MYNYTVHVVQRAHVHDALLLITHVVINNIIIKLWHEARAAPAVTTDDNKNVKIQ